MIFDFLIKLWVCLRHTISFTNISKMENTLIIIFEFPLHEHWIIWQPHGGRKCFHQSLIAGNINYHLRRKKCQNFTKNLWTHTRFTHSVKYGRNELLRQIFCRNRFVSKLNRIVYFHPKDKQNGVVVIVVILFLSTCTPAFIIDYDYAHHLWIE